MNWTRSSNDICRAELVVHGFWVDCISQKLSTNLMTTVFSWIDLNRLCTKITSSWKNPRAKTQRRKALPRFYELSLRLCAFARENFSHRGPQIRLNTS